jgi:hypothetical protein
MGGPDDGACDCGARFVCMISDECPTHQSRRPKVKKEPCVDVGRKWRPKQFLPERRVEIQTLHRGNSRRVGSYLAPE